MCERAFDRFLRLYTEMVAEEKPWIFAVVQEHSEHDDGRCDDARIAGWGLMFRDHLAVLSLDGQSWSRVNTPAEAERLFDHGDSITGLLIWCDPALT